MERLPLALALALLLAVRPVAQQQAASTATGTLVQHVDVFQAASQPERSARLTLRERFRLLPRQLPVRNARRLIPLR
jgi:hypothetical protein